MKAHLDARGKLTIIPETEVEAYALQLWVHNFQCEQPGGADGQDGNSDLIGDFPSTIEILTDVIPPPCVEHRREIDLAGVEIKDTGVDRMGTPAEDELGVQIGGDFDS